MPSTLDEIEYASLYGGLVVESVEAGAFAHAHVLREIARNANRLAAKGNYLCSHFWKKAASDDGDQRGAALSFLGPEWRRVLGPYWAPRKQHLTTATVQIYARITDGITALFQVCGFSQPLQRSYRSVQGAPTVIECLGTGDWEWYTATDVPLGNEPLDSIELWGWSEDDAALYQDSVYGTPAAGTAELVTSTGFYDSAGAWDKSAFSEANGAVTVVFLTSGGAPIVGPRRVQAEPWSTGGTLTSLAFSPGQELTPDEVRRASSSGVTYELRQSGLVRFGAFIVRENDGF